MYILCQIASSLQSSLFLTVMETMDVSNHEQVVICVRWVSADLDVHEDFVELSQVNKTDAGTLVIRNIFEDEYIFLHKLIGQCYNSAEYNYS